MTFGASPQQQARDILKITDIQGGLIVHLGCGDGKLTAALRANDSYLVHGLDRVPANVEKARVFLRSQNLYGNVSVELWNRPFLPYTDNLVNLLVSEDPGDITRSEIIRVLAPGGTAYLRQQNDWIKIKKSRPKGIDEWTHYLYDATNNAVADDELVGPPHHIQWAGGHFPQTGCCRG